ncbi:luciferin 4-monooxygenase-like isoform X2 [Microplitis mediator]|uniref:luciferin 4-monooxygenase-like isoform X2 n=1 Tax=Microplitis mediator TaxID=375433 RepID=UPI0025539BC6|nr:luciferin 4-monooxygenase-like isoform X2 [Microplitis mediator]
MASNFISENVDHEIHFTIENGILKGKEFSYIVEGKNNFGENLLEKMKKNQKSVGQVDAITGKIDTFGEMVDKTIKCALWLQSQNVKQGDVIAICTHNHMNQVVPALAAMCIGAIFNPWWDHGLTRDITKHFINLTQPKILFVNEECSKIAIDVTKELKSNLKIVVFGNFEGLESFETIILKQIPAQVQNFCCAKLSSVDHPALILYTSGTTGLPKGALHSHKALFGNVQLTEHINNNCDTAMWYSTLCWITGILCSFSSISRGMKRVIPGPFIEEDACKVIEKFKVNWLLMGTSMANRLLKSGSITKHNVTSVLSLLIGGAPLKEETQAELRKAFPNALVLQAYGTTELCGIATRQGKNYKINSVGNVVGNLRIKIINPETGKILGPNEKGEACIKSPMMMTKYYNNPEGTKKAIDAEGWLHTGDLTYYDEDGALFIIERLNELIKWRGHHVPPAMIEKLIQTLPGVAEVAIVGVPSLEDDEQPFAFVVKAPGYHITEEEIHHIVEKNLPDQMKLRAGIKFMDTIPHTASGKISRNELKTIAKSLAKN